MNKRDELRQYVMEADLGEGYEKVTRLSDREAMDKYGFWLSPYETIIYNQRKHYRVIFPGAKKGGWAPDYATSPEDHIAADAHINTLRHSKANSI